MATVDPILDYPTPPRSPERLTLEEDADFVRVIFPVLPDWAYILPVCLYAAVALMKTIMPVLIVYEIWHISHMGGHSPPPGMNHMLWHWIFLIVLPVWAAASLWWISAIAGWRRYRKWGRVPRILTADRYGLTLTYLGWWGMRQKHWPANEITNIEFRTLRTNLNWRKTVANLEIHRKKGFPRRFRLSSSDPELPGRIANRIRSCLGNSLRR